MTSINTSKEFLSDKPLAELIKRIRSINELTQESFGQLFQPSVTQPTVARWEKGEQIPDLIHFPKIAYFLNFTLDELKQLIEDSSFDLNALKIEKKIFTPNKQHLKILKKGVIAWNLWRDKHRDIVPVLAGIELSHFNLDNINLNKADLRGAKLNNLSSENSSYLFADLRYAYLNQVYFSYSDLSYANISQTEISFAHFEDATLIKSNFYKSELVEVYFNSTNLSQANFNETNLSYSQLKGANCIKASFVNAKLSNCSVFGASFLDAKLDKIKLENIYIASEDGEGLPINNLALAQATYLQRYNRATIKKLIHDFQMEEEIINLAGILADKYGNYSHTYDFYIFNNYQRYNQSPPYIEARREGDYFHVIFYPDYSDENLVLLGQAKSRKILQINAGIIESNFEPEDINVLKKTLILTEKLQIERVNQLVPLVLKILEIEKSNKFINNDYIIEKADEELTLCINSEHKIELMKINFLDEKWKIVRSSLSDKCIMSFQKLLLALLM